MRHEDNVGYKMRLIHNRIHKQMEAKRIENEGNRDAALDARFSE